MISIRNVKEHKFSLFACTLFIIVLNVEVFIFLSESEKENVAECDSHVNIIYPDKAQTYHLVNVLLKEWKNSIEDQFSVISVPRENTNGIVIVIPFLENGSTMDLLETIAIISNHTNGDEKLNHIFVVLLENHFKHYELIQQILTEFITDISIGFLQLIRVPVTTIDGPVCHYSIMFGKSSKQDMYRFLCLVAASSAYLSTQGSYVWFLNDDVEILSRGFLNGAMKFVTKLNKPWSILDFADHHSGSFTGKLIRKDDLSKFTFFFTHIYSQPYFRDTEKALYYAHLDYVHLMYQSNFITFRPTMMIRRSQISPLTGYFKGYIGNDKWRSNDPSGVILTSMQAIDFKHSAMRAYGSLPGQYFEAIKSKSGDWYAVVFDENVHMEKVIIELGYKETEASKNINRNTTVNFLGKDSKSTIEGILEASPKLVTLNVQKNRLTCADYKLIGSFKGFSVIFDDLQVKLADRPTKCLKLTLSMTRPINNFVIKQLAVFSDE